MGKNVLGGEFFTIEGNNKTSHASMIENRLLQKVIFLKIKLFSEQNVGILTPTFELFFKYFLYNN